MVTVPPCWPPPEFDAVVELPFDEPPPPQPATASAAHTAAVDPIKLLVCLLTSHSSWASCRSSGRTITFLGDADYTL
jgi:hypothetical protein